METKLVFWDFDGVIASTFEQAYNIISLTDPQLTREEYRKRFEGNVNQTVFERESIRKVDFFAEYEKTILEGLLIPGIVDVVRECAGRYENIIVSSTLSSLIEKYLVHHGFRDCFTEILGNDIAHSKVEKMQLAFKKYALSSEHAVFITDTLGDIREANELAVPSIGVLWGFHDRETLEKGRPHAIVETPQELMKMIEETLSKSPKS